MSTLLQDFDQEQSLAGLSIGIAVYVLMGSPVMGGLVILVVFGALGIDFAHAFVAFGAFAVTFWLLLNVLAVRTVVRWPQPRLKTTHFIAFQLVTGTITLLVTGWAAPVPGSAEETTSRALHWLFDSLMLSGNVTYAILCLACGVRTEAAYYLGLAYNLVIILQPFFSR